MNEKKTLDFYNEQARRYERLRARPIQRYTDQAERAALEPYLAKTSDILDLGCGEGRLTRWVAEKKASLDQDFSVHGADFSPEMILQAKRLNGELPATYSVGDAMALDFADDSFDLVISCTAPNNFPNLEVALGEIHRVLRPGGFFFATIINSKEMARFSRYLYYAPYYLWRGLTGLVGKSGGYSRVLYSRNDLKQLLDKNFKIVKLDGMRMIADFIPEFPLNAWPPLYPIMRGILIATKNLDRRIEIHPRLGAFARFHQVVAKAIK